MLRPNGCHFSLELQNTERSIRSAKTHNPQHPPHWSEQAASPHSSALPRCSSFSISWRTKSSDSPINFCNFLTCSSSCLMRSWQAAAGGQSSGMMMGPSTCGEAGLGWSILNTGTPQDQDDEMALCVWVSLQLSLPSHVWDCLMCGCHCIIHYDAMCIPDATMGCPTCDFSYPTVKLDAASTLEHLNTEHDLGHIATVEACKQTPRCVR